MNKHFLLFCSFILLNAAWLFAQTPADSTIIVNTQWTTTQVAKGVIHQEANFKNLYGVPQNINIITIDTKVKGLRIGFADATKKNVTTSELAKDNQALAALNGSYFNVKEGFSVCYFQMDKQLIDTTIHAEFARRVNGAIIEKNGKIKLVPWDKTVEQKYMKHRPLSTKYKHVMASGPLMLQGGKICDFTQVSTKFVDTKHPRSAIAVSNDKKIMFVTVDGRFPGKAEGINIPELAHFLKIMGGKDALNLDGGGSTTLWHHAASENGVVNYPFDNQIYNHYGEREVANIVYVYTNKK